MKFTFLKNTFCCVALALGTFFSSCTKDGDIGPKGDPGEAGPAGDKGQTGSLYFKNGFLTGTITGVGKDGVTPIGENFRYEYTGSNAPFIYQTSGSQYYFNLYRVDSVNRSHASLSFTMPSDFSAAQFTYGRVQYYKKVTDGHYKELTGDLLLSQFSVPPPGAITDFSYDENTGVLSGRYTWTTNNQHVSNTTLRYLSTSSTGKPFTVTGTFSFVVRPGTY
ncbi:MAG: hypothetical protein AVDCRST_MAG56-3955 [uncultured Cytophagales bacterium]|uniref:Lipoprotein n=1 Tax=uncultured Cytophagales bacterium TaxID=158755 RepID=A0A6J4JPB0_9SPHI|nr:MAG: hypothetical protein AVDCRST_MAG56-3955 [uncultured Cytophagales bacterium]